MWQKRSESDFPRFLPLDSLELKFSVPSTRIIFHLFKVIKKKNILLFCCKLKLNINHQKCKKCHEWFYILDHKIQLQLDYNITVFISTGTL